MATSRGFCPELAWSCGLCQEAGAIYSGREWGTGRPISHRPKQQQHRWGVGPRFSEEPLGEHSGSSKLTQSWGVRSVDLGGLCGSRVRRTHLPLAFPPLPGLGGAGISLSWLLGSEQAEGRSGVRWGWQSRTSQTGLLGHGTTLKLQAAPSPGASQESSDVGRGGAGRRCARDPRSPDPAFPSACLPHGPLRL